MTEIYTTRKFNADHTTFGGIIYQSDFETNYRGKDNNNGFSIAQRIINDLKFDEQCRKNIENRGMNKKYGKQIRIH